MTAAERKRLCAALRDIASKDCWAAADELERLAEQVRQLATNRQKRTEK